MSEFKSTLPSHAESARMIPIDGSRRVVAAFEEAKEELRRRGQRPLLGDAAKLLGPGVSTSTYQLAINHIVAVDVYHISGFLPKQEAVRRMRLIDPTPKKLAGDLNYVQEMRSDPEIVSDALSTIIVRAGSELPSFDVKVVAGFLRRDKAKHGETRSALIDLQKWLSDLEKAL